MRTFAVVPTYNEAKTVIDILDRLVGLVDEKTSARHRQTSPGRPRASRLIIETAGPEVPRTADKGY